MQTKEQMNKYRREYRKATNNAATNKYEKTSRGFLMRKYRNMQSRVLGIQKLKSHLYRGLSLLSREDFYHWASKSRSFRRLFRTWILHKYKRKLCPTVDRINPALGYELFNMEWVTHSENSRRGAVSKWKILKQSKNI